MHLKAGFVALVAIVAIAVAEVSTLQHKMFSSGFGLPPKVIGMAYCQETTV